MSRANSVRTDLARVRGLGSARAGTHHWWLQRATAIALVPLSVWFVASVVALAGADHAAVADWIGMPLTAVLLVLLLAVTFRHAQLGMRVVIEDYVHGEGAKTASLLAVNAVFALLAAGSIFAVLQIALGG